MSGESVYDEEGAMPEQFEHGYALIVGVNESSVDSWALPDIDKDVEALHEVLTHPERCAYPEDNVKVIRGKAATRVGILGGLSWLQQRIQENAVDDETVVIYYSGHGWRDETVDPPVPYLVPYDVLEGQVALSALRAADLSAAIAALRPQRLLVALDCCHAGGMGVKGIGSHPAGYAEVAIPPALLMGSEPVAGPARGKGLEILTSGRGRAVLSSSTGEQQSFVRADGRMSIFTYHLIEALTGHAEPKEGATEVLVSDVMSHVWRHVPESARAIGAEQTPDYQVSGNFAISLLLGGKGLSKGQPAPDPLDTVKGSGGTRTIDTGGGTYIEGNVHIHNGDFIGGRSIVYGRRRPEDRPRAPDKEDA